MDIHVISLRRTPQRLATFRAANAHLPAIRVFEAVDGLLVDRDALVRDRVIAADLDYLPGALGCALSHRALWTAAAGGSSPLTVCEDDAVLHRDFEAKAARFIESLPAGWDAIAWTWNFDAPIAFELLPHATQCRMSMNPPDVSPAVVDAFMSLEVDPRPYRLLRSFGAACYTISPEGARWLEAKCFPLSPFVPPVGSKNPLVNAGIDVAMANVFPRADVWVSFPPLALALNDVATSTIGGAER